VLLRERGVMKGCPLQAKRCHGQRGICHNRTPWDREGGGGVNNKGEKKSTKSHKRGGALFLQEDKSMHFCGSGYKEDQLKRIIAGGGQRRGSSPREGRGKDWIALEIA